jgi:L-rhamnose-H+ transport protein
MTILLGIGLHALGGIAAATCYISQKGTTKWSWQTYWIVFCLVAWFVMPLGVSALTVPDLASVLREAPVGVAVKVFLYGALYGFGGMAFALAIRCIGFSMTYGMAIGISAVFGTVVPQILDGTLIANFQKPGGTVVLVAFILSMVGVAVCGRAGFLKERELAAKAEGKSSFDMRKGLWLVVLAGVLSGIFGVGAAAGTPIDDIATQHGAAAGFAGYPKYIFLTGGTLLTNLVWWGIVCVRRGTLREFIEVPGGADPHALEDHGADGEVRTLFSVGRLAFYYLMAVIGGMLWFIQFIFYELGHADMGNFKFISWGIHMAMLVFFSFGVGLVFREWQGCKRGTISVLLGGLALLVFSFGLITYGSLVGEREAAKSGQAPASKSH